MFQLLVGAALAADWPVDPATPGGAGGDAPWTSTAMGVEVQDLVVGTGEAAVEGATVSVHYRGLLVDGTQFDSSRERGRPLTLRLGAREVIPGWEDGLLGMRVGGQRRLVIPPALGYGPRQAGPIPPNSVLYFEVELVAMKAPRVPPAAMSVVAETDWRSNKEGRLADVIVGSGEVVRARDRVCVDFSVYREGELTEHSFDRRACTWYGPRDDDLPAGVWAGLYGMREGGQRLISLADGTTYQLYLVDVHN